MALNRDANAPYLSGGESSPGPGEDALVREQMEEVFARHRSSLKEFAEAGLPENLRSRLDPSDLVQQTLLKGYEHLAQFRGESEAEFVEWLRSILQHQLLDAIRFHRRALRSVAREQPLRLGSVATNDPTASDLFRRKESAERLQWALLQLSAEQREVLRLRQELDLTFAEIGARMQRTADSARMMWARATVRLGKLLKHNE